LSTTVQTPSREERDWPVWAVGAAVILALAFLFHGGMANLWYRWGFQQELSHSYFIPLISGWMLWERRDALQKSMGQSSIWAFALLGFAVFLVFALKQLNVYLLEHFGLLIAAFAVPLLVGGPSLVRVAFFPLAYLVFMIPPPFWFITVTSWNFQLWSSELGVAIIRLFDVPVLLSGNVIELGSIKLQVVEACSGLRYLFPFLSLGALAAYFYKGPLWQRAAIIFATIPITIFMNSFRIAVTGILSDRFGPGHTEGFLHFFEGWVVFVMCIAILLGLLLLMARLSGRRNVLAGLGLPDVEPIQPKTSWDRERFIKLGAGAAAFVGISAAILHSMTVPLNIPERERFAELPLEYADWQVQEKPLAEWTERALGADDYIVLDMVSPEEESFNLYVAYLDQQRNGSSWHSPQQCLPGGGWQIIQQDIVERQAVDGGTYHYNRLLIKNGDAQYLVHYWYQQRGRRIANEFMMKLALIWDVLSTRRSDGAMIRLMTPVLPEDTTQSADERMLGFQANVEQKLGPYIPD
jgi:exosortase D (VPLPA-CTERM-specific)